MSYKEFATMANRHRYIPIDELLFGNAPKHKDDEQDELIFEIPHFGAKMNTQKDLSVKGGESYKNIDIQ